MIYKFVKMLVKLAPGGIKFCWKVWLEMTGNLELVNYPVKSKTSNCGN